MASDNVLAGIAGGLEGVSDLAKTWINFAMQKKLKEQDMLMQQQNQQALIKQKQKEDYISPAELPQSVRDLMGVDELRSPMRKETLKFFEPTIAWNPDTHSFQTVSSLKSAVAKEPTVPGAGDTILKSEAIKKKKAGEYVDPKTKIIDDMGMMSPMADVRGSQNITQDLPSNQSPTGTTSGAASQVLFAARQGRALIAKAGSPQRLALASADLARAVQRSAPQLETIKGADFSQSLLTKLAVLKQKALSDPTSTDVPLIRKEVYSMFTDLDESAKPIVERQLLNMEDIWGDKLPKKWANIKMRELYQTIPDIPFVEYSGTPSSATQIPLASPNPNGVLPQDINGGDFLATTPTVNPMEQRVSDLQQKLLNKTQPLASPKPGGVLHKDKNGNRAWVYPDGSFDEIK